MGTIFRIGDITKTKYWITIERRPYSWRWLLGFDKTYNGTTHGFVLVVPCFSIMGHIRDTHLKHVEKTYWITTPEPIEL